MRFTMAKMYQLTHNGQPVGKRSNIYLDAASREAAERIGNGNISEGIRIALANYK